MKCVFELTEMRAEAKRVWKNEKILAEKELFCDTINFCEEVIGPKLESIAKDVKGGEISAMFSFGIAYDCYNNLVISPLVKDKITYANGDASYSRDKSKRCSEKILEEYLKKHCFKVEWFESWYSSYGMGSLKSKVLKVSI